MEHKCNATPPNIAYRVTLPQQISFGPGSVSTLANEINQRKVDRILVVTDPGVYQAGLIEPVEDQLSQTKLLFDVFSEAEQEPTFSGLDMIAKELGKNNYDLLIGVGGGSSIDTTKGLSVLLTHGGKATDYAGIEQIPGPGIPFFALPTTAGTGAEVTQNAVFDDREEGQKKAMVSHFLIARLALVDPVLTYGCPPKVTAASGIDALVHAIECYTATRANSFSDAIALEAMQLIAGSLQTAVEDGTNQEARNNMSEGALLAGIAFTNTGIAAVHALAYQIGSRFHVPHGIANGLFLPYVMECNLPAKIEKHANIARTLGVKTAQLSSQEIAEKGVGRIKDLAQTIGIPLHLKELGIPREALEEMALATMSVTRLLINNAKQLTIDDVRRIWQNAW